MQYCAELKRILQKRNRMEVYRKNAGWKWLTFYSWILWWELAIFTILFDTFLPTSLLYFRNRKVLVTPSYFIIFPAAEK